MAGGYGYVAQYSTYGFADFTTHPDSAHQVDVDHSQPGNQYNVALHGCTYAYVVGDAGTYVYDISVPTSIDTVGMCATGVTWGIAIAAPYAYVTGNYGLSILSIENPECPVLLSTLGGLGNMRNVAVRDSLACVVGENLLNVADVSDPLAPVLLGSHALPACGWDVALHENFACVADYQAGLRVIDISDPQAPTEVGYYDTPGLAHGIAIRNGLICLADGDYFGVYDFSGFQMLQLISPNGGEHWNIDEVQTVTWTSAGVTGLVTLLINHEYPSGLWDVLSQGILNDGQEMLTCIGPISSTCRVKVVSDDNIGIADESDADFALTRSCLALHPNALDFGEVPIDSTEVRLLRMVNCGTDTLFVDSMRSDNPAFVDITNYEAAVPPLDSVLIGIAFLPTEPQDYVGHFIIYSSAGDSSVLCTGTGIIIDASGRRDATPMAFALAPAYPNPFNATTTIAFDVPRAGPVELNIFDVQGRRVKTLFSQSCQPGTYTVPFNAADLAGGLYFARMRSGDFVSTQKIVLLK